MLFFDRFWCRFWCGLGSLFGSILDPFGHPSWPKFGPSRLLKLHFLQKVDFQKNERHPAWEHDFDPKTAPKTTQDRPKTAPRRSSRAFFFSSFLSSILVRLFSILAYFGSHLGSILGPFWNISLPICRASTVQKALKHRQA